MSNFTDALASGARSGVCQLLGLPQYLNDMTTRLSGGLFQAPLSEIPNLWRRALCDTDAPPEDPPPFTGGQCACATYSVTFTRTTEGGTTATPTTTGLSGPIVGIFERQVGTVTVLSIRHGLCSGGVQTGTQERDVSSTGPLQSFSIVSVQRTGGGADNCGDPPPVYPPLTPPDVTQPRDITYENSDGVNVTIPVTFVYARAQVDVEANITIPFTLNLSPTLNITGNVNVNGDVDFNFGGGTATTAPKDPRKGDCEDIGLPVGEVPGDPTGEDQPEQPEREEERVIKGVLVTVTSLSNERSSTIVQGDNPDIYAPSLGHVNFLCRVGDISAGWTTDIKVKNRRHLIQCPWDWGAIAVEGTPQPGVTWVLTPVYGLVGEPVQYVQ